MEECMLGKKRKDTAEALGALREISTMLNTGLNERALVTCVALTEKGAPPESVAKVILEIREGRHLPGRVMPDSD
ncbi:uncharacterized protein [Anabrus simplex]|uniref:uncharacterized protein n=1 Tax=Anabrus simplex TaxID=316456 RepID=UPI0034DD7EFA